MIKALMQIFWLITGSICFMLGATLLAGWPGFLVAFGLWAFLSTTFDIMIVALQRKV